MTNLYPPGSDWPAFVPYIYQVLGDFVRDKCPTVTAHSLRVIDSVLQSEFAASKAKGDLLQLADGLAVVGGWSDVDIDHRLIVRWVGGFYPGPRWACPPGELMPLGFFEQFDLYYGHLPEEATATLIASYGNGPCDYYAPVRPPNDFRPPEIEPGRVRDVPSDLPLPVVAEAWRRIQLLNVGQESKLRRSLPGWL